MICELMQIIALTVRLARSQYLNILFRLIFVVFYEALRVPQFRFVDTTDSNCIYSSGKVHGHACGYHTFDYVNHWVTCRPHCLDQS